MKTSDSHTYIVAIELFKIREIYREGQGKRERRRETARQ
jgi:hypothetical protein